MSDIAKLVEEYVKAAENGGRRYGSSEHDAAARRLRGAISSLLSSKYLDAIIEDSGCVIDIKVGIDTVKIEIQHDGELWIEGDRMYRADIVGGTVSHDRLIEAVDEMFALLQSIPERFEWAL